MRVRADMPIEDILIAYARAPITFRTATRGMSDTAAATAPADGAWSVAQVVTHLWLVDGHALATFAGAYPPARSVMRPAPPVAFARLLDEWELRRATVVAALRNLPADQWDATFSFRSAERTARQLVSRFANHDMIHLRQIEQTRRAVEGN